MFRPALPVVVALPGLFRAAGKPCGDGSKPRAAAKGAGSRSARDEFFFGGDQRVSEWVREWDIFGFYGI